MFTNRTHQSIVLSGLVFLLGIFSPSCVDAREYKMLQIKGSDTMVNLGQAWAEEFMVSRNDVSIAVTGGGSGTGIAAILSGTCDIAQSSRDLKGAEEAKAVESGAPIVTTIVGLDGVAVVTHPLNPISNLTITQLSDIFTGKVTNWKEVGGADLPILALSRERNSGTHIFFLEEVLRKGNSKGPEEFSSSALMMPSNQAIVQEVKTSEAGIGYVGIGYLSDELKVIPVGHDSQGPFIVPTVQSVADGQYPISRSLLFLTRGEPQGDVRAFINFVLSAEGQEIVEILDFVPINH
ncbi:MAG: phosphate ABC transporter substrate-binding protein [Candidatus Omnitrophota bacterium]|nr:phosphate ABC transporter substrate-binding protein [Candidatus Omnitrophota bacterium]